MSGYISFYTAIGDGDYYKKNKCFERLAAEKKFPQVCSLVSKTDQAIALNSQGFPAFQGFPGHQFWEYLGKKRRITDSC